MPPTPGVRYYRSRGGYYTWFRGEQKRLAKGPKDEPDGPTFRAACRAFAELSELSQVDERGLDNPLRAVCETYLVWAEHNREPGTFANRKRHLDDCCSVLGNCRVCDLTKKKVRDWLNAHRAAFDRCEERTDGAWSEGTCRLALDALCTALSWAVDEEIIPYSPIAGIKRPSAHSRGIEALLGSTDAEREATHQELLAEVSASMRPILTVLRWTGARISEVCKATAAAVDAPGRRIVYRATVRARGGKSEHKNARHGKDRVIYLFGDAWQAVEQALSDHPSGPLFPKRAYTHNGVRETQRPWTSHTFSTAMAVVADRIGRPEISSHSYRHTFATAWLEQGRSVELLATLLGVSPSVIHHHYGHLTGNADILRRNMSAFLLEAGFTDADTPLVLPAFDAGDRESA